MAVDPRVLAAIGDPTAGRLTDIGQTYVKTKQATEEHELEKQVTGMKMKQLLQEEKRGEVEFMGDTALSMKAYYDQGGDAEGAMAVWETHKQDAATLGYKLPDQPPTPKMAEGLASRSKQYVNYLNATKASDSAKKFQVIATLAAIPENKRTDAQQRMFEALTKPNIAFNISQPTTRTAMVAKNYLKSAEKDGVKLEDEIDGFDGYRDDVSTRAQAIQAEAEKSGKAISLSEAMKQAHEELQHKLIPTDTITIPFIDKEVANPFKKKFIYHPDAEPVGSPQPETGGKNTLSESQMKAVLKGNNLEDTPQNREMVNKEYSNR